MPSRVPSKQISEFNGEAIASPQPAPPDERLLSRLEVCERTGKTYPTIWAWMRAGKFPRARDLNGRPAWLESEINAWISSLPVKKFLGEHEAGCEPKRPVRPKNKSGATTRLEQRAR
jgi:predicted DNA-binding transcriptional regulator AlpA